jgi:hypothetical protein
MKCIGSSSPKWDLDRPQISRAAPEAATVAVRSYWAIRLFCSTFTRLSVQKVQLGP